MAVKKPVKSELQTRLEARRKTFDDTVAKHEAVSKRTAAAEAKKRRK